MTAADTATEIVADVAEEVADQAQHVADVSRGASGRGTGLAMGAFLIGAGIGGGVAYVFAKRQLELKYAKIADDEIAEMREHYHEKALALEAEAAKGDLEDIVAERGYTTEAGDERPPMAVAPPTKVVEAAAEATEAIKEERTKPAPVVPVEAAPQAEVKTRNVFEDADEHAAITTSWDQQAELRRRSPDHPYVIHYDERDEFEGYSEMTLTYYEADDVLCNERDEIVTPEERDRLVGEKNLERFGHGSNDPSIVYVRNDSLELMMEVVKSPNSYAEEVHGLKHTSYGGNLERMRAREREELDDD